jgi:histidyl-tRNA synthetase
MRIQPLLPPSEPYFSGMFFELHAAPSARGAPSRAVAAGGRYDALIETAWPLASFAGPAPKAVGLSFSVSRLAQLTLPPASPVTDVLVAARGGGGLLAERLALTAELWRAGVRAETLPQPAPSLTQQYEAASARSARLMLIAHPGGSIRVKHLRSALAGKEEDCATSEVVRLVVALLQAVPGEPQSAESGGVQAPTEHQGRRDRASSRKPPR